MTIIVSPRNTHSVLVEHSPIAPKFYEFEENDWHVLFDANHQQMYGLL